jgi:hypothetical protein
MADLYQPPGLDLEDRQAIDEINAIRVCARFGPARAETLVGRTTAHHAGSGDSRIEHDRGLHRHRPGRRGRGRGRAAAQCRRKDLGRDPRLPAVLTYVLNVATEPGIVVDDTCCAACTSCCWNTTSPKAGNLLPRSAYVHDERRGEAVYEGAPADEVPELMRALAVVRAGSRFESVAWRAPPRRSTSIHNASSPGSLARTRSSFAAGHRS